MRTAVGVLVFGLAAATATDAYAQGGEGVTIQSRAVEITISGRVQQQFNTTSVDAEAASAFLIRRARPELDVVINDFVEGKLSADFGEGELDLKDAYVRLNFDPALVVTLGQFKRPFDLFELTSSTQILVIERVGGIRGAAVTSLSRFTESLEYSDRDIGVQIAGRDRTKRFQWMAAVTNGNGANAEDEDGVKAFQARLGVTPIPDLTVWGGVSSTPYAQDAAVAPADADHEQAIAFQVDAEWGNYTRGLHVQAGLAVGDNWAPVLGDVGEAPQFLAWQVIGAYKVPVTGSRYLQAWEPVFRLSQGDPDTDVDDDGGWLITPGFVLHFAGRNKLAFNYDLWSHEARGLDTEGSFKAQAYLHF